MLLLLGRDDGGAGLLLLGLCKVHALVLDLGLLLLLHLGLDDASVHGLLGHLAGVLPLPLLLLDLLHGPGVVGLLVPQVEHARELLLRGGAGIKVLLVRGLDLGGLSLGARDAVPVVEALEVILLLVLVIRVIELVVHLSPVILRVERVSILAPLLGVVLFLIARADLLEAVHGVGGALPPLIELADRSLLRQLGLVQQHSSALRALCGITKVVSKSTKKWESKWHLLGMNGCERSWVIHAGSMTVSGGLTAMLSSLYWMRSPLILSMLSMTHSGWSTQVIAQT